MKKYVDFVTQHKDNYSLEHIGNMDEVTVYFDMSSKFILDFQGSSDIRITTTGSEHSRFTVVLYVTASRIKLPAYVIFRRKRIPKFNHSSNVIVSSNEKSCMTTTETLLWHEEVWMK